MSIGNHGTLEISYAKSARVGPLGSDTTQSDRQLTSHVNLFARLRHT